MIDRERVNECSGSRICSTAGPWKAERADLHGDDEPDPNRWSVLTEGRDKDYFVATIENGAPGDCCETEQHNAALIAAAPDMLEVLREVALPPYPDSDVASLLETLRSRATAVLDAIESELP